VGVSYDVIGWGNVVLPLLGLLLVAGILPWLLAGRRASHRRVMMAVVLLAFGALVFVVQYQSLGNDAFGEFAQSPLRAGMDYLQRSLWLALLWAPVLAFLWLMLAQGVERRRGLAMRDAAGEK
jgi:uncharacterized membrane protein YozB (DUF420 family)